MKRITKKTDTKEGTTIGMPKAIKAYWKLKEYEDIEEELGIDLTLRHKVEASKKLYCRYEGEIVETRYCHSYGKDGVGLELPIDIEPYCGVFTYLWKDYGKTWALTKEELLK